MINQKENKPSVNLIMFAPERMGEVTKFRLFASSTYILDSNANVALSGIEGHFQKYTILMELAQRLAQKMVEDEEELKKLGYSRAIRSKEFAAIMETLFCELYSAVDCTRQVIGAIYGKLRGVTRKSTSKLFTNATDGIIDDRVPIEIRKALAEADWFPKLDKIRNAIIHSNVGFCSNHDGRISYFHDSLGKTKFNVLAMEDVLQEVATYADKVNKFHGIIFRTLNGTLRDTETTQFCGIFGGRVYQRSVFVHDARNFHSGKCKSYEWFEKDTSLTCPFTKNCGAYARVLEQKTALESAR